MPTAPASLITFSMVLTVESRRHDEPEYRCDRLVGDVILGQWARHHLSRVARSTGPAGPPDSFSGTGSTLVSPEQRSRAAARLASQALQQAPGHTGAFRQIDR